MKKEDLLNFSKNDVAGLHDFILSVFRNKFTGKVIGLNLLPLAHECWATILVKRKLSEMDRFAKELESELKEELGREVSIFIKVPLKARLKNLLSSIWKV